MSAEVPLSDLKDWVEIAVSLGVALLAVWRSSIRTNEKLNGLGERVHQVERDCATNATVMERQERELETSRADRIRIHERVGRVEQQGASLSDQVTQVKIDIIGHVDEVKRLVQDSGSKIRERLVRLETVTEIERKLGRQLTELNEQL